MEKRTLYSQRKEFLGCRRSALVSRIFFKANGIEEENCNKIEQFANQYGEAHTMNRNILLITEENKAANISNKRAISTLDASITKFHTKRKSMHNNI